jgi:hypothetical protein
MISISEFFKRIGGVQANEIAFRTGVRMAVKEIIGADIKIEAIYFRSGRVILKGVSPTILSVVFIKKVDVMKRANELQSVHKIIDIR